MEAGNSLFRDRFLAREEAIDGKLDNFDTSPAPIVAPAAGDVMTLAEFGRLSDESRFYLANVNPTTFGLVYTLPVDDRVYAQPLYVPQVAITGQGTHNVVYVATMSDTLYAFDADGRSSNPIGQGRR